MGTPEDKLGRCGVDVEYTIHGPHNLELAKDKDLIALIETKKALSNDIVTEFVRSVAGLFPSSDLQAVWKAALTNNSPGSGTAITLLLAESFEF